MAWQEITINTVSSDIEAVSAELTAGGFSDLVIEDQAEFETFLDENRAYWDSGGHWGCFASSDLGLL